MTSSKRVAEMVAALAPQFWEELRESSTAPAWDTLRPEVRARVEQALRRVVGRGITYLMESA